MSNNESNIPLTYKGRPLLRKDNIIYYGSMTDKYIAMLQILSTTKVNGWDVTDPDISSRDRITKSTTKDGLYNAMDIASIWLDRALTSK